jgi:ribonuclease D
LRRPYRYLIDPLETREALAMFVSEPIVGLDTETYWDSTTRENSLSLLQIARPQGDILIIDALSAAIMEARFLVESAHILKVAHNAKFDEGSLKSVGFVPAGLLDSLRLARKAIPLKSFGLASVANHLFGIELDKTHQRSDWLTRPLSRAQLEYAALDAEIVLAVYEGLAERLMALGRWEKERERACLDYKAKKEPRPPKEKKATQGRPLTAEERREKQRNRRKEYGNNGKEEGVEVPDASVLQASDQDRS